MALGVAYQLFDGSEHALLPDGPGPTSDAPPVRLDKNGAALIDLIQIRSLRRALLFAYSPTVSVLTWAGTLTATTYGGGGAETRTDPGPPFRGTLALLTLYNVGGELVARSEMTPFHGPPEMAARAFGYDIGWSGGTRPVTAPR